MHHYFEAITNTAGQSLIGYFVRVIDPATQAVVTLASDNNGTPIQVVSGVANMAKTDEFGNVSLYVAPGTYNVEIYGPDATSFLFRVPNVAMNSSKGDPGDPGPAGPAGTINAFATLAALLTSDGSKKAAQLVPQAGETAPAGNFNYINGAWVRQAADGITIQVEQGVEQAVAQKVRRQSVNLEDYRQSTDGPGWYAPLRRALAATKRRIQLNDMYGIEQSVDFGVLRTQDGTLRRDFVVEGWGFETGLKFTKAVNASTSDVDRVFFRGGETVPVSNGYKQTVQMRNLSILGDGQGEVEAATGSIATRALTAGRLTTQSGNGFSGSNSYQIGFQWEMEAGSSLENMQLARFERGFKTKLGYGGRFYGVHARYNLIGFDLTAAVTSLEFGSCVIERNGFGAFLWISSDCSWVGKNVFQANYAGCDVNVFIGNQGHLFYGTYFEASPRCIVVNGGGADPAQFMNTGFDIRNCKALRVELLEYADNFNIEGNRMVTSSVTTPPTSPGEGPSFYASDTSVTNIRAGRNIDNNDPRQRFTNYLGPGAPSIAFTDAPYKLVRSQTAAASVPGGASDSFNVTIVGARAGNAVTVTHTGLPGGWDAVGHVVGDDTVRVDFRNFTGATAGGFTGTMIVAVARV